MADWAMPLFTMVVALALLMETVVIAVIFVALRRLMARIERISEHVKGRVFPMISEFQVHLDEVRPRVSNALVEATELSHSSRKQVVWTDRLITETTDGFRIKLVQADEKIGGTLELIEDTGSRIRHAVFAPVRSIKALTAGIQTGINVYRTRSRQSSERFDPSEDWISPETKEGPSAP